LKNCSPEATALLRFLLDSVDGHDKALRASHSSKRAEWIDSFSTALSRLNLQTIATKRQDVSVIRAFDDVDEAREKLRMKYGRGKKIQSRVLRFRSALNTFADEELLRLLPEKVHFTFLTSSFSNTIA
jgi:hypothetical protein